MNKRFFNQQNLTRRLRMLSVLFAMLLLPIGAWAQTTYQGGDYTSTNGSWGDWTVTGTNVELSSSDGSLMCYVPAGQTSTIELSMTQTQNTSEKLCALTYSPGGSSYSLLSAKIVDSNDETITEFTTQVQSNGSFRYFTATTPIDWGVGKKLVLTCQLENTTNTAVTRSISGATVTTGTPYDLVVDGIIVTTANKDCVTGGTTDWNGNSGVSIVSFDPTGGKLNLCKADLTGPIQLGSSMNSLTIDINGESDITTTDAAAIIAESAASITFTTSSTGSLNLKRTDGTGLVGSNITLSYNAGLSAAIVAPTSASTLADATEAIIKNLYSITVAGVQVTETNAGNVLEDAGTPTVIFTPADYTVSPATSAILTLNSATISNDDNGIEYSGTENLTIKLKGSNTVSCSGEGIAIKYSGTLETPPTLTIAKGDTNPCSLVLEAGTDGSTINGFTVSSGGLYSYYDNTEEVLTTTYTTLGGGSGESAEYPIFIKTKEDLRDFAKLVNRGTITNEYIKLNPEGGELDCNGLTGFEPIGICSNNPSDNHPFIGKFDGNNCTINNLAYSTEGTGDYVGLFGIVGNEDVSDAKIEKLTLSSCSFNGGGYVGGIVGEMVNGTIENCVLSSCIVKSGNAFNSYAGGIAGQVDNGTINNCTFISGLVDGSTAYSGAPSTAYAGGIVGCINGNTVTVSSCTLSSTNVKSVTNGQYGAYYIYVGGLVGRSLGTAEISDNKVTATDNTKKISCQSSNILNEYLCGAIIGDKGDATLSNNTYEYDVTTDIAGTTKSGYTQRGIGGTTYNTTTQQNEPNPDIFTNNGAVMDTRLLAMPGESSPVTALGDDGGYYAYATGTTYGILGAPGKPVKVTIDPKGNTITDVSVTYGTSQTATITKTKTEEGISFYTISEMPDADDATLNVTCDIAYDLWIGETQVTDANKDHILGEGNTSVKFAVTGNEAAGYVNTLTLNGAALTVPVKVGLDNLTIDIQGSNTITTNTTCIQNTATTGTPSLTFKSTSDVVGSLTLKNNDEDYTGVISESFYSNNTSYYTISRELALIMLRYGNYTSNTYYFTAGEVHDAQLVPSYGVQVNDMQVYEGNSTNVLGDGKVSFDKSTHTLTLNNANGIEGISTTLSTLDIDLVGSNTLYRGSNGSLFESASGEAVTINLKSTNATGALTMETQANSGATLIGGNVTLTPVDPVELLTNDTANNQGTMVYGVDYGLTVADVPVRSVNASNVLGSSETATVVFTPADNTASPATPATLTLNGADNLGTILSGLENLKVVINGDNAAVQVKANSAVSGDKNITFVGGTGGTNGSTLTISAEDGGSAVSGFASVSYDGVYAAANVPFAYGKPNLNSPEGYVRSHMLGDSYLNALTITTVPHYPIWVYKDVTTATQVNNTNKNTLINTLLNASGNISFDDGSNILTLQNVNCEARIVSGLSELTISIDGDCIIQSPDTGTVVRSINASAPLTIEKASGASSASLKLAAGDYTAIKAFASLDYTGLILLSEGATYSSGALNDSNNQPLKMAIFTSSLKKPTLRMYYPDVDNFSGDPYYKFVNPNGGGTVKYSRYFASESINDDINQTYNDGTFDVMIDSKGAPVVCKVWVEANGSVSDTLYACRLDVENMEATYGDTNVPVPTLLPQAVDGVTTTYALRDTDVETHAANITSDGTISLLSPGQEWLKATFTVGDGVEYIKNASDEVPSADFYIVVKPSKPTLSHETGSYVGTQTVTFTDEFVDNQNITAWYYTYEGEEPANPTVNPVPDGGIPVSSSENVAVYYRLRYDENDNVDLFAYSDTTNVAITILEDIDNCPVTGNGNVTYTGVAQTPTLTVTPAVGGEALVLGTDYTVSYKKGETAVESMVDAGDYTIVITAKEGSAYGGTKEVDFTIDQANLGDVTIAPIADQTYTGSQITPTDITVTFNGNAVSEDEYTISYGTNINVGEGTVTLTSKNKNFSTSSTKGATFTIVAKTLTADMVISVASVTYTGSAVEPELTIRDGDLDLEKGTDYTVIYSDNVSAGTNTAKATITGKGNYTGSADKMFTINKAQLTVTPDDKTYNVGDNIELTVSYDGFVDGDDEDVLTTEPTASYGTADITKPGSYEITASGGVAQNYDFIYETGTLTINRQLNVSFSASNTWATYCGTENLATPEGLQAYQVTAVDGSTVTSSAIGYIPANTAVLLKDVEGKAASANIVASAYEGETTTFPDNILQGGVAVDVSTITGGTVYVLYKDMFKRATGGTIPANRGYLVVAPSSGNAPELSITIGDDTTGIGTVGCDSVATDNDEWYTLDGQKLQQAPTQKGLYIKNGKKVVINKK